MQRLERYKAFLKYFTSRQARAEIELDYATPFQLAIAVVLSAQCTDKRVNTVTPALFEAFPTPQHLASSHFEEVFPYIKSISYPNNKTKYLISLAARLVADFDSKIPDQVADLKKLAGIGRKSAHVIASELYNQPTLAVDTHVFRVSRRLGLVSQSATTPLAVEKQLMRHLPKAYIPKAHHWLILHGRYVCKARNPQCVTCKLTAFCRYFEKCH